MLPFKSDYVIKSPERESTSTQRNCQCQCLASSLSRPTLLGSEVFAAGDEKKTRHLADGICCLIHLCRRPLANLKGKSFTFSFFIVFTQFIDSQLFLSSPRNASAISKTSIVTQMKPSINLKQGSKIGDRKKVIAGESRYW